MSVTKRRGPLAAIGIAIIAMLAPIGGCATTQPNPAAAGFNEAGSDAEAIAIADGVMARLGGRQAWDDTGCIAWTFFGARSHVWDRRRGIARVQGTIRGTSEKYVTVVELGSRTGVAWLDGEPVTDEARRVELVQAAYEAWINDSYWLVMPYKLKDSGVTLGFVGFREMEDGRGADVIELTFDGVGVTPDNKYHVYVATDNGLVGQWDFFLLADDTEPRFKIPWRYWTRHGQIMLSGDRGRSQLTDIAVFDETPVDLYDPLPVTSAELSASARGGAESGG